MQRFLTVLFCILLFGGCRSAPKSAEVINAANARTLAMLIYEYSTTRDAMPPSIYVLDLTNVRCGDRQARFSDLRCVSGDRKVEADFLYFRAAGSFSKTDPDSIVLASPFPSSPDKRRLVVTAAGKTAYLHDSEFLNAMAQRENREGEQVVTPNGP
jgi:hypothetical protein